MAAESTVWKRMLLRAGKIPQATVRMFRNNVGFAWIGRPAIRITPSNRHNTLLHVGDVVVRNARPFDAGLFKGSGDGIGWSSMEITPDMVGRRIAVFTSAETKKPTGGKVQPEQWDWYRNVREAGGIAVIVKHEQDLELAIEAFKRGDDL